MTSIGSENEITPLILLPAPVGPEIDRYSYHQTEAFHMADILMIGSRIGVMNAT